MNRWILGAACAATAIALGWTAAPPACAQETKASGEWVCLFDGKSLDGWKMTPLGQNSTSKWDVVDGALSGTGSASMLACTKGPYKNLRFRAEIKINDHGNSGMYIHCPNTKPGFVDGYEIQINSSHADPIRTGSVYTMVHIFDQLVPPDTWFTQEVELIVKDYRGKMLPHFRVWVNGKLLYQYIDHSNEFPKAGYVAFQQHDPGSKVQIRKIEVMELP